MINKNNLNWYKILKVLVPTRRNLNNDGIRQAFKILKKYYPKLDFLIFNKNEKCGLWTIPLSWDVIQGKLLDPKGKKIAGYAASAKSTTVFNYCNIGPDVIDYIADSTKEKIGKYSPGKHIPIISHKKFCQNYPDYAYLLIIKRKSIPRGMPGITVNVWKHLGIKGNAFPRPLESAQCIRKQMKINRFWTIPQGFQTFSPGLPKTHFLRGYMIPGTNVRSHDLPKANIP